MLCSWTALPQQTRQRILAQTVAYLQTAHGSKIPIVMGGIMFTAATQMEHMVFNVDMPLNVVACGHENEQAILLTHMVDAHASHFYEDLNVSFMTFSTKAETNAAQLGDFRLHYATPHLDAFIDNMERLAARETDIVHFFECINSAFMYGNVLFVDSTNEKTQNRVPWPWKFENFLRVTQEKRAAHFVTLAAGSARDRLRARDENLIFEDNDMKMIMNNWRGDAQSWMREDSLREYRNIRNRGEQNQYRRKRFSTYTLTLIGNKVLVGKFIQFPLFRGDAHPSQAVQILLEQWLQHKQTPEYQRERQRSRQIRADRTRLSAQILEAQKKFNLGRHLDGLVFYSKADFFTLSEEHQELVQDYNKGKLSRVLKDLQDQRTPKYSGVNAAIGSREFSTSSSSHSGNTMALPSLE